MKKTLAAALGAILAAASAAPAYAAGQINIEGFYRASYMASGNLGLTSGDNLNEN